MIEEIKEDNNCIVKAFENNPIAILHEDINNKKVYYFKASDIGKALCIVNIRSTIQNYDDDERVVRNVYDPYGTLQDTTFLTSQGVYRLLYNSKKEIAKKFRKWAGNILDDIIFNESVELKKQLQENEKMLLEKDKQISDLQKLKVKKWYNQEPGDTIYAIKINSGLIKIGKTKNIKDRETHYVSNQVGNMFYIKKCFNCDLAEKVLHHVLDKHRIENNKEWFGISEELAIYTIDIVVAFLDKFIDYIEDLPLSNIKETLNKFNGKDIGEYNDITPHILTDSLLGKVVNIESNEEKLKRFVDEYCELDENNYVLSYEILGAYRLWSRGFHNTDRTQFTKFIKKYYKSKRKYYKEYNESSLLVYLGIKPKELRVEQENNDFLPEYEEFILTECKYNYTYRIRYSKFIDEYRKWYTNKYPQYIFSKEQKINMEAYINRHFLKDKVNMPNDKNVPGIWGLQMKSDNSFRLGANSTHRKEIVKIDCTTKKVIEEYKSIIIASQKLHLETKHVRASIVNKKIIQNFILEYKKDVDVDV